jgi:hypothetical protein
MLKTKASQSTAFLPLPLWERAGVRGLVRHTHALEIVYQTVFSSKNVRAIGGQP